nr:MAG TPA: hypothetical protein [Caudoviricetes sp.]
MLHKKVVFVFYNLYLLYNSYLYINRSHLL